MKRAKKKQKEKALLVRERQAGKANRVGPEKPGTQGSKKHGGRAVQVAEKCPVSGRWARGGQGWMA